MNIFRMFSYKSLASGALISGINSLLITCLTTDARLTADHGVVSSIQARSHTDSFKKGNCQLQVKSMCTNYWLTACSSLSRKKCG